MIRMKKRDGCGILVVMFLLMGFSTGAGQQIKKPIRRPIVILPDMVIENIQVTSEPVNIRGKIRIRIDYSIRNDSAVSTSSTPTEAGEEAWSAHPASNMLFNIRVEARSWPKGIFEKIAHGGSGATMLAAGQSSPCNAGETIAVKAKRQYRIIVDYGDWIREKNEDNNRATFTWPANLTTKSNR